MIQDILGNEIYTKEKNSDTLGDRTIYYCITIPGENDWVRKAASNGFNKFDEITQETSEPVNSDQERLSFSLVNYSFPIPSDGKNKSCLIKVYDLKLVDSMRVNDIVHVRGFVEPSEFEDDAELLTSKNSPSATNSDANNKTNGTTATDGQTEHSSMYALNDLKETEFQPANDFPHKLVPRVHVETLKKLTHINPMISDALKFEDLDMTRLKLARVRLETILSQLLGGDTLAANYITLCLLSKIIARKETTFIGQLAVNICGLNPAIKILVEKLYGLISKITTHSHLLNLSIANLNNLKFTPQRDHDNNKMIAGTLQLPDGLFLMIDEIALEEGLLTQNGIANVGSLNQIIRYQTHKYDFKYSNVEIDTDLSILVLSEGKTVLDVPIVVKLDHDDDESVKQACESLDTFLTEELLNMFRHYISSMRQLNAQNFHIPDDVQESITTDFVKFRDEADKNKKTMFSADDLSDHMTLARLLTISRCEQVLTKEIWTDVCKMEVERKARHM